MLAFGNSQHGKLGYKIIAIEFGSEASGQRKWSGKNDTQ
jgi:hypothetical protein